MRRSEEKKGGVGGNARETDKGERFGEVVFGEKGLDGRIEGSMEVIDTWREGGRGLRIEQERKKKGGEVPKY